MDPLLHQEVYTDLLTFTFCGPNQSQNQPLFIDAHDTSRSFTGAQFRQLVRSLIAGFKAHNVQQGDSVLVHLGNSILYPALFFGIIGAGGVYMGSNPRSQRQELDHSISLAEPKLILTTREALPMVLEVGAIRGIKPSQICLVDEQAVDYCSQLFLWYELGHLAGTALSQVGSNDLHLNFANILAYGEMDWLMFSDPILAQSTPAAMFSTSGTGGLPKAAILSHHALVSHHRSIQYDVPFPVSRLMTLPMFHLFGSLWTHIFPVRYGQPLFILSRFDLSVFLETIQRYQISETYLVPATIHTINRSPLPLAHYLSSLRYVGIAGAPIDEQSVLHFRSHLHSMADACQLWGMTEVGVIFQTRYGQQNRPDSIGTRLPGYEVRLVDQDGRVIQKEGYAGELYVRGAGLLMAYKGRNDAKDPMGWFRTGDVAFVKQGQYFIVGRTKELIKVRGWQVAPAEVEGVLLQHPGVKDVAVTGVDLKDGGGEVPRAFIVRSQEFASRLTADEAYNFARQRLASYKALAGGVIFVEEIPRTASGKIQRFKLSQMNTYREMVTSLVSGLGSRDGHEAQSLPTSADVPQVMAPEGLVTV